MTAQAEYAIQQALIAALAMKGVLPDSPGPVKLIETHISWVLLHGRYAYKVKKAVNLGFLDFTGLDRRRLYCEEEVRLNRRLAPKTYLDVVPIGGSPDSPSIGVQPAIEYAVRMRRFAAARQFDKMLAHGRLKAESIDKLAACIAAFHSRIPSAAADSLYGTAETIHGAVMDNFDHLLSLLREPADRNQVVSLRQAAEEEFEARKGIIEQRRNLGFIRECHGDLHLGNIVEINGNPVPFDCVEFNPELRWIDLVSEVAFLVMDLMYHRHAGLAFRFLNGWLEATGDYSGMTLLRFYLAYRATVRAKVCAIRSKQGQVAQPMLVSCRNYLAFSGACFVRRQALIITHGLPGSGKSTFAMAAAERLQAIRIRSDVERKRIFGIGPLESSRNGLRGEIYSNDATIRTYARLLELAKQILDAGFPVVVDAAFIKQKERSLFLEYAAAACIPIVIVSMQADSSVLRRRILQRKESGNDASEADLEVLEALKGSWQPLGKQESLDAVKIESGDNACISEAVWIDLLKLVKIV